MLSAKLSLAAERAVSFIVCDTFVLPLPLTFEPKVLVFTALAPSSCDPNWFTPKLKRAFDAFWAASLVACAFCCSICWRSLDNCWVFWRWTSSTCCLREVSCTAILAIVSPIALLAASFAIATLAAVPPPTAAAPSALRTYSSCTSFALLMRFWPAFVSR